MYSFYIAIKKDFSLINHCYLQQKVENVIINESSHVINLNDGECYSVTMLAPKEFLLKIQDQKFKFNLNVDNYDDYFTLEVDEP